MRDFDPSSPLAKSLESYAKEENVPAEVALEVFLDKNFGYLKQDCVNVLQVKFDELDPARVPPVFRTLYPVLTLLQDGRG